MDKFTLEKEQLKELKNYIHSRGFHEPIIVMEILDHFACLVEEKMQTDPKLPFKDAMQEAHKGFGVRGFKALADAADNERNKHFTKIFRAKLAGLFVNPKMLLLIVLVAALSYNLYVIIFPIKGDWVDGSLLPTIIYLLIFSTGMFAVNKQVPDRTKRYVSGYASLSDNGYSFVVFLLVVIFPKYPGPHYPVWPFAVAATLITVYTVLHMIAQYKTVIQVVNANKTVEDSYWELDT